MNFIKGVFSMAFKSGFAFGMFTLALISSQTLSAASYFIPDLGFNAKHLALGNIASFDDAPAALFSDPAALSSASQGVSAFYTSFAQNDVFLYSLSGAYAVLPNLSLGLGISQFGTRDIPLTAESDDDEFTQTGSFAYTHSVLKASIQYQLHPHWSIGSSASYFNKSFHAVSGQGANLDFGIHYAPASIPWAFSVFGHNILPLHVSYASGERETFDPVWNLAARFSPEDFDFVSCFWKLTFHYDDFLKVSPSFASAFYLTQDHSLALMASVREVYDLGHASLVPAAGVVVDLHNVRVDYSIELPTFFKQSTQHYFGVNFGF